MRRTLRSSALLALAGGTAALGALLAGVDRRDLLLDGYMVFLAGVAAFAAARIAADSFPAPRGVVRRAGQQARPRDAGPEELDRIEDIVALGQADALDLHFRLRPVLADIASAGYASASGVHEPGLPAGAEPVFSPGTWELIRPDRPRPSGAVDRGIDTVSLRSVLDDLESILPP
jgi:hypothetical protein